MSGRYGFTGLEGIAALAVLSAMNGGRPLPKRDTTCRYSEPAGPPAPVSRQVRRAMMRKAKKLGERP
jgi:hypothetical protein